MNPLRILSAIGNWFTTFVDFLKEKNSFAIAFLIAIGLIIAEGFVIYIQDGRIQAQAVTISKFGDVLLKRDSTWITKMDAMRDKFQGTLDAANAERIKEQAEMLKKFGVLDSARNASNSKVVVASNKANRAQSNVADLKRKSDSLEKLLKKRLK